MKNYEIILFDLDDTLIDNVENVRYAFRTMTETVGVPYTEENFQKWFEFDKQYWIDRTNGRITIPKEFQQPREKKIKYVRSLRYYTFFEGKLTLEEAFEINELYLKSLNEKIVPIEGVYETLEYLHTKYKIVVATNGPSSAVNSKLSKINCINFIDYIFSADMTKQTVTKPKKEFFDELLDYINYHDTKKMLIVGDSLHTDIKGGIDSNIDSCWFNKNNEENTEDYSPTIIINNLIELKEKL